MSYETLEVSSQQGITTLTINRPQARNALSRLVLGELFHFLSNIDARGVILTGSPGPAFIAGADIREMAIMTPDEGMAFGQLAQDVTRLFEQVPVPLVACVDGYALGGGCEMALACDFVYATSKAVFGQPEVRLGLIPGFGGCVRLQRLVGPGRAREMIYTGRPVDATEAHRIGLANQLFDTREEMLAAAAHTLTEIAANSASAVALCKSAINEVRGQSVNSGLDIELEAFREAFTTPDMREGTTAFLAKRPPEFKRPPAFRR
jgi:enoyl-CoA hydratase